MKIFGFAGRGLSVSIIKHAHHTFDVDQPGKDSWRHRHAGCNEVLVTSSRRWVLMHELRGAAEPPLAEHVKRISPCDLLLVEGFKRERIPKLEVYRAEVGEPLLHPHDGDIDDHNAIAEFVLRHVGLGLDARRAKV